MAKPIKILTRSVKFHLSLLIISTGLILYGTLFPADYDVPKQFFGYDKLIHFLMFGTWTFFYGLVRFLKNNFSLFPVFMASALFGLFIEILQYFLPTNRTAELIDFVADVSGTAFALLILYLLAKKLPEFKTDPAS
ncbi:MAG: VanZ family protein [Gracilimonas sp.]